jgi:hypothetical protein
MYRIRLAIVVAAAAFAAVSSFAAAVAVAPAAPAAHESAVFKCIGARKRQSRN